MKAKTIYQVTFITLIAVLMVVMATAIIQKIQASAVAEQPFFCPAPFSLIHCAENQDEMYAIKADRMR